MNSNTNCSINNIYRLEGRVPIAKAIPFGLQHILAMFVSNLAPITIIAGAAQPALSQAQTAILLQNAMFVAGIATMIQLYPIWRIGSKLPVVMGVSFTFVTVLSTIAANYGYPAVVGAVLIGGIFEGTLGLLAKYWRRIITPVVAASVVTAIGFSLFTVGARSFGGGYADDFGSAQNLILGTITLLTCLLWNIFAKGYLKQLSVLAGLIVGYVIAIFLGKVDLSLIMSGGIISFPHLLPFMPEFHAGAIILSLIHISEPTRHHLRLNHLPGVRSRNHRRHIGPGFRRFKPGNHGKGNIRLPGLRRLRVRPLHCIRMSSRNLILPECGPGGHDKGGQPFHNHDRGGLHDFSRTSSACGKLFCLPASGRAWRMHHHDVRHHPYLRRTDDCQMRFFPEKHSHCLPLPGSGHRFYHSQRNRDLGYLP